MKRINEKNLCEIIKEFTKHDSEYCLKPYSFVNEFFQTCHVITWRNTAINLAFFEREYGLEIWVSSYTGKIKCLPSGKIYDCLYESEIMKELLPLNKTIAVMFIYSLFLKTLRKLREILSTTPTNCIEAFFSDEHPSYDTIYNYIKSCSTTAYAAAISAGYLKGNKLASVCVYDAFNIASEAIYTNSISNVYNFMKKAFKSLIKYRKEILKKCIKHDGIITRVKTCQS